VIRKLLDITHSEKRGATSSEIADALGISRPAVIQHLRDLENKNIIESNLENKKKLYYIKPILLGQVELYFEEDELS